MQGDGHINEKKLAEPGNGRAESQLSDGGNCSAVLPLWLTEAGYRGSMYLQGLPAPVAIKVLLLLFRRVIGSHVGQR